MLLGVLLPLLVGCQRPSASSPTSADASGTATTAEGTGTVAGDATGPATDSPATAVPLDELARRRTVAMARGRAWLLAQQSRDGGWHSATYGQMRCGPGNTALVLAALTQRTTASSPATTDRPPPDEPRLADAVEGGLAFLLTNTHPAGFVRNPQGEVDFPTYATALTLSALCQGESRQYLPERQRMVQYLVACQETARKGWKRSDREFGGWGHIGGEDLDVRLPGDVQISVTTLALQTLRDAGAIEQIDREAAETFLGRCATQSISDGEEVGTVGFFFTSIHDDLRNKAGWTTATNAPPVPKPYGTATADAVNAFRALGHTRKSPAVRAGTAWLLEQTRSARVPGFTRTEAPPHWDEGLQFYFCACCARALADWEGDEAVAVRGRLLADLLRLQRGDGSWQNPSNAMREDDPLIATALAITALTLLEPPP